MIHQKIKQEIIFFRKFQNLIEKNKKKLFGIKIINNNHKNTNQIIGNEIIWIKQKNKIE